jgi:hypothetical protein
MSPIDQSRKAPQFQMPYSFDQQSGIPAGRAMPVPFGSLVDVEPTVLLASEDAPSSVLPLFEDVLLELVSVGLLSRTILVLTSQHSLEAVLLDPEPVPVPCAVAVSAAAKRAAPVITARQTLPIMFPPSLNPNKSQCGLSNSVPLNSHSPARAMFFGSPASEGNRPRFALKLTKEHELALTIGCSRISQPRAIGGDCSLRFLIFDRPKKLLAHQLSCIANSRFGNQICLRSLPQTKPRERIGKCRPMTRGPKRCGSSLKDAIPPFW